MCGLVAVVNKLTNGFNTEQKNVFDTLLYLDVLRGEDSTGVFAVSNSGNVQGCKDALPAAKFQDTKEYKDIIQKAWTSGSALIGHNRKATRGTVVAENAHPFVVDENIILVHNGTMWGDHKKHANVEVDSHAIAHLIHQNESVEKALSSFDGAYALIWYDVKNQTLNFVRNSQRPLCWTETNNSFIWASSEAMLNFVIDHYDLRYKGKPAEIRQLSEDTLVTFTLKNSSWGLDTKDLTIVREVPKSHSFTQVNQTEFQNYLALRRQRYSANGYYDYDTDLDNDPVGAVHQEVNYRPFDLDEWEKNFATQQNKIILHADLNKIQSMFPPGSKQYAIAYDYVYANGRDSDLGYYLYLLMCEDSDVLVRVYLRQDHYTEERVVQLSAGQYVYEVEVDTKAWISLEKGQITDTTCGYLRVVSRKLVLVHGGGVVSSTLNSTALQ